MTAAAMVKRRALITTGSAEESTRDLMTACCVPHSSAHACSAKMAGHPMSSAVVADRCNGYKCIPVTDMSMTAGILLPDITNLTVVTAVNGPTRVG